MDPIGITILSIIGSVAASSGFWAWLQSNRDKKDTSKTLLLGLAHSRIMSTASEYLHRGCVTKEEYDDLITYLYEPYKQMGGNGTAKVLVEKVGNLPLVTQEEAQYHDSKRSDSESGTR